MIRMTNMTLALPTELIGIMKKYKDIKWSEVAREALWDKARSAGEARITNGGLG